MNIIKKITLAALVFLPIFTMAEFTISEYKYQKDLVGNGGQNKNHSFVIDSEIYKNGNQFFADLRIIDKDNAEIPYLLKKNLDTTNSNTYDKELKIVSKNKNSFVLDMGEKPEYHQQIEVVTNSFDFSRVVDIYGSNLPDSRYEKLNLNKEGELVAVVPGNNDKEINFKYKNYRYIKLIFSGKEGDFVPEKFTVKKTDTEKIVGDKKTFSLKMEIKNLENAQDQKILFESPGVNTPIDSIIIHSSERDFSRNISIYSSNDKDAKLLLNNSRYDKNINYWKKIYSGSFSEQIYSEEQVFSIKDNKKYYLVIIENADNEKLNITGATATRFLDIVYTKDLDFLNNSYKVFYGNIFAKKPNYDVVAISKNIKNKNKEKLTLSKQENNPSYLAPKEKLGESKPYLIYLFIGILIFILFWFVYKIMREVSTKDEKEETDIIDKL